MHDFLELAQTPATYAIQEQKGSLGLYDTSSPGLTRLDDAEVAFIEAADSFYMATVNEDGWPYVQHKGGEPGFVRQLGGATFRPTDRRRTGNEDSSG